MFYFYKSSVFFKLRDFTVFEIDIKYLIWIFMAKPMLHLFVQPIFEFSHQKWSKLLLHILMFNFSAKIQTSGSVCNSEKNSSQYNTAKWDFFMYFQILSVSCMICHLFLFLQNSPIFYLLIKFYDLFYNCNKAAAAMPREIQSPIPFKNLFEVLWWSICQTVQ